MKRVWTPWNLRNACFGTLRPGLAAILAAILFSQCTAAALEAENQVLSADDMHALRLIQRYAPELQLQRQCMLSDSNPSLCVLEGRHSGYEHTFRQGSDFRFYYYPEENLLSMEFDEGTALRGKISWQVFGEHVIQSVWSCGTDGCNLGVVLNGRLVSLSE
ncbi:MAG: hypothetical protein KDK39_07535 [Leptospiraceae bacterium]|nr:hypothetical protein [Leptospiraceae bacterium]